MAHSRGAQAEISAIIFIRRVFPACAGMNRRRMPGLSASSCVPRPRGDEPGVSLEGRYSLAVACPWAALSEYTESGVSLAQARGEYISSYLSFVS